MRDRTPCLTGSWNLLSFFPFESFTTVTMFLLCWHSWWLVWVLFSPLGFTAKNAAGRLKKPLLGVHHLCATMMHLYGTSVQSYRKGWFPGLTVRKSCLGGSRPWGVTESRKECHLFWLNTDLMPWDCVAALAQAKSDTKEGAWLLVARQHPWALVCHWGALTYLPE